jgi:MFS family permease
MERNIILAYWLTFFKHSWFWLGIWILYYLKFTNYAGIGIIETVFFLTITLFEIPTGAIADIFGKKKTLIISFSLQAVGVYFLSTATNLMGILTGGVIAGIGGSMYSGTFEALVYDSLKEIKAQDKYDRVIANISSISFFAPAVCAIIGGYLYTVQPSLPFAITGLFYSFGLITCFFLAEPHVDTIKFSIRNFLLQTKVGIRELTKTRIIINQTMLLLAIGLIVVICDEMLNQFFSSRIWI